MSSKKERIPDYLQHILDAIERITVYTEDIDEVRFINDTLIQDAVVRNLEVIGEAAKNIERADPTFIENNHHIPWVAMYSMRNRLSHGYFTIDFSIVWHTLENELPKLYENIKQLNNSL